MLDSRRYVLSRFAIFLFVITFPFAVNAQPSSKPTEVIVAPVLKVEFADKLEALGTAKANETVEITADTTEKIRAIYFEDGQFVSQGDVLIELDKNEEEAELKAAQAQLSEAQTAYKRAKNLQGSNAMSKATLSERFAALKSSEANVEALKARLEELVITAPFDGVLGLREVSVGALVQPGDKITTIDDLTKIKVDFDVPSVYLASLKSGLPVTARVEAYSDRVFSGAVQSVNTQIDPVTRTVRVRAILPNPDNVLKPGLLMSIILDKDTRQTVVVPEEAVIKRSDKDYVFVIEDDNGELRAKQKIVELGGRSPGDVEVVSGIDVGEQVVVHGIVKLRDGAAVTIRATETNDQTLEELLKQGNAE